MKPIRVTYIHQDGVITGSAISLMNLLSGFEPGQVEATVLMAKAGPVKSEFERFGAKTVVSPFTGYWTFPGPKWYWPSNFQMQKALLPNPELKHSILGTSPDVIHVNDKAALAGGVAARNSGIPIVQHLRSNYHKTYSRINKGLSRRAINSYASAFIAISEDEVDGFEERKDLQVIYNTINQDSVAQALTGVPRIMEEFGLRKTEVPVVYVGLLNENKGAWIFLETCGILKKKFPEKNFRFIVVAPLPPQGTPDDESNPLMFARKMCREQGIETETIFTGFRKDVLSIVASAHLLLVMNKQGVLGRQPFEAMSVGVPVVAVTGHSGRSHIIEDGKNGLLVSVYDPEMMAEKASIIIGDEDLRRRMGEYGREKAREKFNPRINSQQVYSLYCSLIKTK